MTAPVEDSSKQGHYVRIFVNMFFDSPRRVARKLFFLTEMQLKPVVCLFHRWWLNLGTC